MKYIKNTTQTDLIILGQTLAPNGYYLMESADEAQWASSSVVIQKLSSGELCMAKDDSGTTDIADLSTAVDFLKNNLPSEVSIVSTKPFFDAAGFRARFKGYAGVATAGAVTMIDHVLTEERFINGIRMIFKNHVHGDYIRFQIVDKNYQFAGTLYAADYNGVPWSVAQPDGVVLDEFGSEWYVAEDQSCQPDVTTPYPARILAGMAIRFLYKSTGTQDVDVKFNLYLHLKAQE